MSRTTCEHCRQSIYYTGMSPSVCPYCGRDIFSMDNVLLGFGLKALAAFIGLGILISIVQGFVGWITSFTWWQYALFGAGIFIVVSFLFSSKKSTESKRVGQARKDEVKKVVIATKKTAKKAEPKK